MRGAIVLVLAAGLALGGTLVTASGAERPARAQAFALIAAGSAGSHGEVASRGTASERREGAVSAGGLTVRGGEASVHTSVEGGRGTARAVAVARSVNLLDGLVTAYGVRRTVQDNGRGGMVFDGRVSGLRIGDETIGDVAVGRSFQLPDGAGTVLVNQGTVGLQVVLTKPAGGQPAGTDIRVAVAQATARNRVVTADPTPTATPEPTATADKDTKKPKKKGKKRKPARKVTEAERARLSAGGYAFPVYGEGVSIANDFGGPRQIGPHQGNDVFGPFGAPVLAVADGVLSKVGTLPISGNRLWLTSNAGDGFFYAHLSAFSAAAVDGRRVKAGTVLGFVGNTGDAEPTPPHVHFEIHPGGAETGAVNPNEFLVAWQGRRDVAPGAWLQRNGADTEERPGALVAVRDFIAE